MMIIRYSANKKLNTIIKENTYHRNGYNFQKKKKRKKTEKKRFAVIFEDTLKKSNITYYNTKIITYANIGAINNLNILCKGNECNFVYNIRESLILTKEMRGSVFRR